MAALYAEQRSPVTNPVVHYRELSERIAGGGVIRAWAVTEKGLAMKFTKALLGGAAAAMLAAAPVTAQVATAPVDAQGEENAFGSSAGSIAAIFAVLVFASFLIFHGEDEDQPVSP